AGDPDPGDGRDESATSPSAAVGPIDESDTSRPTQGTGSPDQPRADADRSNETSSPDQGAASSDDVADESVHDQPADGDARHDDTAAHDERPGT
ncbi:MAG: hypothetical protein ACRDPG_08905, partial [Nocardioidaceae bacterium]